MRLGEPHEAADLGGVGSVRERAFGPDGAALLGTGRAVVHAVVEPGRQPRRGRVEQDAGTGQLIEPVEHLGQVTDVVVAAGRVGVRREQGIAVGEVVGQRPPGGEVGGRHVPVAPRPGADRSRWARSRATTAGSLVMAHRMVRVASAPSGRAIRSWAIGSIGRPRGSRDHAGIRPTAAATSTPYGTRAATGQVGVPDQVRDRLARMVGDRQLGPERASADSSSASDVGGSTTPSLRATTAVCATYSSRSAWSSGRVP